jgi:hypothetical protein
MDNISENTTDASLEKILISYSEFERLKNIESEYLNLQKSRQRNLEISTENPSTSNQIGEGSDSQMKKQKLSSFSSKFSDSDDESDFIQHITNLVASKIQGSSTSTNLFSPSKATTTEIALATPNTTPPLPYSQKIQKDDENDIFGNLFLLIIKYLAI